MWAASRGNSESGTAWLCPIFGTMLAHGTTGKWSLIRARLLFPWFPPCLPLCLPTTGYQFYSWCSRLGSTIMTPSTEHRGSPGPAGPDRDDGQLALPNVRAEGEGINKLTNKTKKSRAWGNRKVKKNTQYHNKCRRSSINCHYHDHRPSFAFVFFFLSDLLSLPSRFPTSICDRCFTAVARKKWREAKSKETSDFPLQK